MKGIEVILYREGYYRLFKFIGNLDIIGLFFYFIVEEIEI